MRKKTFNVLCWICSILVVVALIANLSIFTKTPKDTYSVDNLKELLTQTQTMIVCRYDAHNPYKICSNEDTIETITDKNKIDQIISLIMPLEVSVGTSTMEGAALVVHALDKNENLLMNVFYSPYIGIEKGDSFYSLSRDIQTIQNITEILNLDPEKLLLSIVQ